MMQLSIEDYIKTARYEGPVNAADCARLEGQTLRIYRLMIDGNGNTDYNGGTHDRTYPIFKHGIRTGKDD